MEERKEERTVLITLEIPADVFGLKVIRRDTAGYESEEYVCLGMLRDVQSCVEKARSMENEKTDAE
jgi:hypothetical protein